MNKRPEKTLVYWNGGFLGLLRNLLESSPAVFLPVFFTLVFTDVSRAAEFAGKEYLWIKERKTQLEAQAHAESLGGHLVVINSEAEDDFVYSMIQNSSLLGLGTANDGGGISYVWLGGDDAKFEGSWRWVNDDPFVYTNWGRAEPDNYFNQDGLAMGLENWPAGSSDSSAFGIASEWNDIDRSNELTFIVERPISQSESDSENAPDSESETDSEDNPGGSLDTDGDGVSDSRDLDDDGDGLNDSKDPFPLDNTKPFYADLLTAQASGSFVFINGFYQSGTRLTFGLTNSSKYTISLIQVIIYGADRNVIGVATGPGLLGSDGQLSPDEVVNLSFTLNSDARGPIEFRYEYVNPEDGTTEFVFATFDGGLATTVSRSEVLDSDQDGVGNLSDAFPFDASEQVDTDGDGIGDNSDVYPEYEIVRGNQFLQTTSDSLNVTSLHVLNTSDREQSFRALMYDGDGNRVGGVPLIGDPVQPMGRIVLTSQDIETLFNTDPWKGPAVLQVRGESSFDVMSKLESPSGLVSNTNCVREDRVLNIEGFDSNNMSFVRLINTRNDDSGEITGTLYDFEGNAIGNANSVLTANLGANAQTWISRDRLATKIGAEWDGEGMLEVNPKSGLKLLNLNYITDEDTFFNFSCFEDNNSGRVYLQTTSTSANVSLTHLVNTSDTAQQLTGTMYGSDGSRIGAANQPLHSGTIPSKGRVVISSEDIENAFNISPWSGPAILEVNGSDSFELMTKLTSPSGLISNTNCVRENQIHNIGGFDQTDMTYVRFINIGDTPITNIRGSLYDTSGNVVGAVNPVLIDELPAKAQVWRNRNQLSDLIGDTWNGTASLKINNADTNLRLLNLNFINSETFFNFSCYETGQ